MAWWRREIRDGLVVGVLGIVAGAALAVWAARGAWMDRAAGSWPVVEGVVLSAEEVRDMTRRPGRGPDFRLRVEYRYIVEGRPYTGTRLRFGKRMVDRDARWAIIARYGEGTRVDVYVDPDDPERAILEPGITKTSAGLVGLGLLAIGLGIFGVHGTSTGSRPEPRVVPVGAGMDLTPEQARLFVMSTIGVGVVVVTMAGFYLFGRRDPEPPPPRGPTAERAFHLSTVGLRRPVEARFEGRVTGDTLTVDVLLDHAVLYATDRLGGRTVAYLRAEFGRRTPGASTWSGLGESELILLDRALAPGDSLVLDNVLLQLDRGPLRDLSGYALVFEIGLRPRGAASVDRWVYARSDTTLFRE